MGNQLNKSSAKSSTQTAEDFIQMISREFHELPRSEQDQVLMLTDLTPRPRYEEVVVVRQIPQENGQRKCLRGDDVECDPTPRELVLVPHMYKALLEARLCNAYKQIKELLASVAKLIEVCGEQREELEACEKVAGKVQKHLELEKREREAIEWLMSTFDALEESSKQLKEKLRNREKSSRGRKERKLKRHARIDEMKAAGIDDSAIYAALKTEYSELLTGRRNKASGVRGLMTQKDVFRIYRATKNGRA